MSTGCLLLVGISMATALVVASWDLLQARFDPSVAAIRAQAVATVGVVVQPMIDGFGGDPAVAYRYTVTGHTYDGYDIGNSAAGNVLALKPGDPIHIQYAATMPSVSCLAGSTDCPNDVFDPYFAVFIFWSLALIATIGLGFRWIRRRRGRRDTDMMN